MQTYRQHTALSESPVTPSWAQVPDAWSWTAQLPPVAEFVGPVEIRQDGFGYWAWVFAPAGFPVLGDWGG